MTPDQIQRYEKGQKLRGIVPVIAWLYERNLVRCFGIDAETAANKADEIVREMRTSSRRRVKGFIMQQVDLFGYFAEAANPGARESHLGEAMRRISLLSTVLTEFSECDGDVAVQIVDAYLNSGRQSLGGLEELLECV